MKAEEKETVIRTDSVITTREQKIAAIQKFTLFSDTFARIVFEDVAACQYVLRILTGDRKLQLRWVKTQYVLSKLASHDAWLDVIGESASGAIYAMEIQNWDDVDHSHRVRFYESMIDSHFLEKGRTYDALPDVTLIYICRMDFLGSGVVSWSVEKYQGMQEKRYEDGLHTMYINAEIDDGSETAGLMQYFLTANPEDMNHGALSERVRFLKYTEKGWDRMCEVTDLFWRSGFVVGEEKGEKKGEKKGERKGERRGERRGMNRGIRLTKQALMFQAQGKTQQEIAKELNLSQKEVAMMLE